jgi:hypothetical protein
MSMVPTIESWIAIQRGEFDEGVDIMRTAIIGLTTIALMGAVNAADINALKKGDYMPTAVGCKGLGGSGSTYFDGKNLSFHYSFCKTQPIGKNTYHQTCVEAQGPELTNMTMKKLEKSPDRTEFDIKLRVLSPTKFQFDNSLYKFCP